MKLFFASLVVLASFSFVLAHGDGDEHIIVITDNGFDPQEIEIVQGDTIVFQNKGEKDHWPASDIHPTHEMYPDFDPQKPILPGSSWRFAFERMGTMGFHDHVSPEFTGIVRVKEFAKDEKAHQSPKNIFLHFWQWCKDIFFRVFYFDDRDTSHAEENIFSQKFYDPSPYVFETLEKETVLSCSSQDPSCVDEVLQKITASYGPKAATDLLYHWQATRLVDRSVDDHQLAHAIGRETARVFGANPQAFLLCPMEAFNGGCNHGFFEYVLGRSATPVDAGTLICGVLGADEYSQKTRFSCYHGVGHGVMMARGYNLKKALDICDSFPSSMAQEGCWQGVFMENINGVLFQEIGQDLFSKKNPLAPCDALDDIYRHECYINHAGWLMHVFNNDIGEAADACLRAEAYISSCLQSLGLMTTNPSWQGPVIATAKIDTSLSFGQKAWEICKLFPKDFRGECVVAAVDNIANFDVGKTDRLAAFCGSVSDSFRRLCYERIGINMKSNATENSFIYNACGSFGVPYQQVCLTGAGL
ncbi:MAG: hypothetical protein Q8O83_02290 [bacterium]|nr:hypothetical protein [bacterium]